MRERKKVRERGSEIQKGGEKKGERLLYIYIYIIIRRLNTNKIKLFEKENGGICFWSKTKRWSASIHQRRQKKRVACVYNELLSIR